MTSTGKGKGGHRISQILRMVADGFGRGWFGPAGRPYAHEANLSFHDI